MIAIVDCNSFYCSCERLFRPDLDNKPVIVLSNNDGCIIARSDEAKALGIDMGVPYFQAKKIIQQHQVATFSSNYNLYGNLSWRVMETLKLIAGAENVEVYSVDEAFITLHHIPENKLETTIKNMKQTVEEWTGIKVSIGAAPTKVLSKVANRLCKKDKFKSKGVMVLNSPQLIEEALKKTKVADVWGIGRQYNLKLEKWQIFTAYDLSKQTTTWAHKNLGGVVGVRLVKELQGMPCIELKDPLVTKQMIATTRMFGNAVTDLKSIKEAVATYTARAAEKLRRQHSVAEQIEVFLIAKEPVNGPRFKHGPSISAHMLLPWPTAATNELIRQAAAMAEQLFEEGKIYKKAGVILSKLTPETGIQQNMFAQSTLKNSRLLMETIDNINFSMRNDMVKFGTAGTTRNWKMQQNFHSPRYTTRWNELYEIS